MTGRFYITFVIHFTKQFHGSADFAFQTHLKGCLENKVVGGGGRKAGGDKASVRQYFNVVHE